MIMPNYTLLLNTQQAVTDSSGYIVCFSCPKTVGEVKVTIAMVVTTNKQAVVISFFIIVSLILMRK